MPSLPTMPKIMPKLQKPTPPAIEAQPVTYQEITWWEQELLDSGISLNAQRYIGVELSSKPQYARFVFQYPPNKQGEILSFKRLRLFKSHVAENPNAPLFINPEKDMLPNGEMPPFYTPNYRDMVDHVHSDGGRLYMFEGASDTWAMISAGVYNVAGLFAASSTLNGLAEALREMGVKAVSYYTDSDNAGQTGASRLAKYFSDNSTVTFSAYNLRGIFNGYRIKDVRDLWLATNQDTDDFRHALFDSVQIDFEFAEKLLQAGMPKSLKYREIKWDIEKIYTAIFQTHMQVERDNFFVKGSTSWSRNFPCPFHDDNHPSFGWNTKDNYGWCFAEGKRFNVFDLCERFDLNWRDFAVQDSITVKQTTQAEKQILTEGYDSYRSGTLETRRVRDRPAFRFLDELLDERADRLSGAKLPEYPPIIMPFKKLHQYGGFAHFISRPRLIALVGMSGGFKTTVFNALIDGFLRAGENGFVYSPEWSTDAHADRFTQMNGGLSVKEVRAIQRGHHETVLMQTGKLTPEDELFGREVTPEELMNDKYARDAMKNNYRGKLAILDGYGNNLWELLLDIEETIQAMRAAGHSPSWGIIDYIQLVSPPPGAKNNWNTDATILEFKKKIAEKYGLALFIATQVRKNDAEKLRDPNSPVMFDSTGGNNMSDWYFNLMIGVAGNSADKSTMITGASGARYIPVKLGLLKNSEGQPVKELDDAPTFYVDAATMRMYESYEEAEASQGKLIDVVF